MGPNVPLDWKQVDIGEVTQQFSERNGSKKSDFPVLSVTNSEGFINSNDYFGKQVFSKDLSNYKIVRKNQFAYNPSRINVGSLAKLKDWPAGLLSPMYVVFQTLDSIIPEYLEYWLNSGKATTQIKNNTQGTVRDSVSYATLSKFLINLPPLPEQKKIAAILNSVDNAIQATQAVIDQTRRVKQGLMQQLLTRGIGHTRFKQTEIGEIPEEWKIHSLEKLCTFSNGHGFKAAEWSNEGFPIIRIQNLNGSREFNYYSGKPESKWIVESGEFLFAWAGVKGVSFGPCIWNGPRGVLNQHIYRIRPKDGLDKRWLFETMKLITNQIEERAHGFKYNLLHVRKADITNQIVPVPPFEEQQKISELSEEMLTLENFNLSSLNQLNKMKSGLMQDLLTGRVRVKLNGDATS